MKTGTISLYKYSDAGKEVRLSVRRYSHQYRGGRTQKTGGCISAILDYWQAIYPPDRFKTFWYQIAPDIENEEPKIKQAA